MTGFSVVVPSVGRPSLRTLLAALTACEGPRPKRVVVVDDRVAPVDPVVDPVGGWVDDVLAVRHSTGLGPAGARNIGWQACDTEWVAFLDDDVLIGDDWLRALHADLSRLAADVAGSQARIRVPLPAGRRPTDWERGTAGLATAKWITADMAYRRAALLDVGGFDERFPRAFREDADIALRMLHHGWRLADGDRVTTHPVRPAPWDASLKQQRGNADDELMTRIHGRDWYERAAAPRGRRNRHLAITAGLLAAATGAALRRPALAFAGAVAWAAGTGEFAWARIAPGPRTRDEVARMALTSALIPPAATWHRACGLLAWRNVGPLRAAAPPDDSADNSADNSAVDSTVDSTVEAVLFDRDGTLIHDVPYNGDPDLVRPVDGAREALDRLRAAGLKVGVISNQSGVARGLISEADVKAVNARVEQLLGPFDTWQYCPHDDAAACACRKPAPGMVLAAARELGVPVERCAVVGDIGADVAAGEAAGAAVAILVPTPVTRADEVIGARRRLADLHAVAEDLLRGIESSPVPPSETREPAPGVAQ